MWRFRTDELWQTVPYADARSPYYRKQAFDFGDGGAGNCANNLELGCDCLGVIKVRASSVLEIKNIKVANQLNPVLQRYKNRK